MKCPHCSQEHPDNFQYCPATGKKLISHFKACTYKQCLDYGKYVLPSDSKFCPTCGSVIENEVEPYMEFLSFYHIILGKNNIYDIDTNKYEKFEEPMFGNVEIIVTDTTINGCEVTCIAKQSDKNIFSILIDEINENVLPESWKRLGINYGNLLFSVEKFFCRNGFDWDEFDVTKTEHHGLACKQIYENQFMVIDTEENSLMISILSEELKDSLYTYYGNKEYSKKNNTSDIVFSCPKCGSDNIEDDGTDYLQYICKECGHNWGHDDTEECPECGSDDIENDGTNYIQYECNNCGHIWGDEGDDDDEDNDAIFQILCSIVIDKLGVDKNDVTLWARFVEDLGADSLDLVELVMEIEKEFLISIPDDVAENLNTVGEVVDYIGKQSK